MKQRIRSISLLATLAVAIGVISWGSVLHAQNTPAAPPDQQTPSSQQAPDTTPPPDTTAPPSSRQPSSGGTPDSSASSGATDSQTFSGTVEKQGDKYVLKDDTGKVYDIDHQDEVKKFDGKRVRVKGTLDETGKKILVK